MTSHTKVAVSGKLSSVTSVTVTLAVAVVPPLSISDLPAPAGGHESAQVLLEMWKAAGINVKLELLENFKQVRSPGLEMHTADELKEGQRAWLAAGGQQLAAPLQEGVRLGRQSSADDLAETARVSRAGPLTGLRDWIDSRFP